MNKKTVKDVNLNNKKVIIRVDFNVPLDDNLNITDDRRIEASLPTIKYILSQSPKKLIIMSHLGRPEGAVVESMRLSPCAKRLQEYIKEDVLMLKDCIGKEVDDAINGSKERVIMLENLRFHKAETKNNPDFSKSLAALAEIYVNDAFGTAHRAHASTEGITHYLPSVAGFLLEQEIKYLGQAVSSPQRPYVVILGGAKVSDKIELIENLLSKADTILIGGGMAYTFLKALGKNIGKSLLEEDKIDVAKQLLEKAKAKNVRVELSCDFVVAKHFDQPDTAKISEEISDDYEGLDIGPKTRQIFKDILAKAKTVVWNGPVGVFEVDAYAQGTKEIAEFLSKLKGVTTIVGGGDSAAAVKKFNVEQGFTHISTGGGASLEFLEGKVLPGVEALNDKQQGGGCGCCCG